jgi:tRNA pseudouridine13 synthase
MSDYPYGEASLRGVMKSCPEDFVVVEELGFEPSGQGEHLFLLLEKRDLNTQELVERIAKHYALKPRDIGISGLKDKRAVTRQWLSLPAQAAAGELPAAEDYRVLAQGLHSRKLRRGTHRGNYFEIRLREVDHFTERAQAQLEQIRRDGFANYFGGQRFGSRQDNVAQALRSLSNPRLPRWRRGLYLSALRSHLFNRILARRIELDLWRKPLDGDVFMLRGSHSVFSEPVDETIRRRFAEHDIDSSASLYGSGSSQLTGQALEIETEVFAAHADIVQCLDQQKVKRQMRAMRALPQDFEYAYDAAGHTLELKLRLPAGCYLTSLLDHVLDAGPGGQG